MVEPQNINVSSDKFFYVFTPTKTDKECFCGISLETSVRIITFFTIFSSCYEAYNAFIAKTLVNLFISLCVSTFFIVISFYIFISTINHNYIYCQIGYHIFTFTFLCEALVYSVEALLMCLGFINPYGADFFKVKAALFTLGEGILLLIYGWCLWEIFCYYILLRETNEESNNCNNNEDRHEN